MDAIGLRVQFQEMRWQDLMTEQDAGHLQICAFGLVDIDIPVSLYGKSSFNPPRFHLADYDRAFEQYMRANNEADRIAAARKMSDLVQYYAPIIPMTYLIKNVFVQPWLLGFYPAASFGNYWKYLDIDLAKRH